MSLSLARQSRRLRASTFKDNTFGKHTNNYNELSAIESDAEIAHSQTYASTSEDTNATTRKDLSQNFSQICDLFNEPDHNDFISTLRENCNRLEAFLNVYLTVSTIRKMLQKVVVESISKLEF